MNEALFLYTVVTLFFWLARPSSQQQTRDLRNPYRMKHSMWKAFYRFEADQARDWESRNHNV